MMRCLSLWQPWASLWCSDAKEHETRDWELHHHGWLLVHAAKTREGVRDIELDDPLELIARDELGGSLWRTKIPFGSIIGAVFIVSVRSTNVILKEWGEPVHTRHWIDHAYQVNTHRY